MENTYAIHKTFTPDVLFILLAQLLYRCTSHKATAVLKHGWINSLYEDDVDSISNLLRMPFLKKLIVLWRCCPTSSARTDLLQGKKKSALIALKNHYNGEEKVLKTAPTTFQNRNVLVLS